MGAPCRCKEASSRDVFAVTDACPLESSIGHLSSTETLWIPISTSASTNTMAAVARNGAKGSTSAAFWVRVGTQVSCWLGESLVRYASLPNKATEVTKLETSALGWRRVWRERIGTPLDELGGNSEAFSPSRDRSSVVNGVCGRFEVAAGLVMPLRGSIAGRRRVRTGLGLGSRRGHD